LPGTSWFHPLGAASLADLTLRFDPENPWWRQAQAVTAAAIERWRGLLAFGVTDLGGNLDILASLRGSQDLLLDLVDAPEELDRLVPELTAIWLRYHRALFAQIAPLEHGSCHWGGAWFPTFGYFLQSDFSYMISPKAFERLVLPDLAALCDAIDYPVYHLDGKGEIKHLNMLLSLQKLRCIQWISGDGQPSADKWPEVLSHIRAGGKLCQIYTDREGAFRVAREHGGARGFAIDVREVMTDQEAEEFLRAFWHEFAPGEPVPGATPFVSS
jgi:hypothetical protein